MLSDWQAENCGGRRELESVARFVSTNPRLCYTADSHCYIVGYDCLFGEPELLELSRFEGLLGF